MANLEHIEMLKHGSITWNHWRAQDLHRRIPDLQDAELSGMALDGMNLSSADLRRANLSRTNLRWADLRNADLSDANLAEASLIGTDLRGSNLRKAALRSTYLQDTDFRRTTLRGADFREANLLGADLTGADLSEADFTHASVAFTVFGNVDLASARGLELMVHIGPSVIGADSLFRAQGRVPEAFLQGAGVPDDFITYMKSFAGRAIEYHSCFISYSSKDQDFAERLHADLQAKGVRCWFAPEDMKIGDKIWDRLDQSIRLHDKLLLILSANSIGSEWVEDEVTTAFEEERKRGKTVLFPVRVDDAIFSTHESWAAKVRQRHIGEFSNWKDHDAYKRASDRLLRDLKAETPVAPSEDASH